MKNLFVAVLVASSVANATCVVKYVYDPLKGTGGLRTLCDTYGNEPTPDLYRAPRPKPAIPMNEQVQGNTFNPFGGAADAFTNGLMRGMGR